MQEDFEDFSADDAAEDELYLHHKFVADKGQKPLRVDKFLMNFLDHATRNKVQKAAEAGSIQVNGITVKSNHKVKPADVVTVVLAYPPREIELVAQDIPLDILYRDEDVVVINKAAGLVVHPGHGNFDGTLVNALLFLFSNLPTGTNSTERPGLVHRLDKNTSGVMVVAASEIAMASLAKQFFARTTNREYFALVWGNVKEDSGTIVGHIGRSLKDRKVMSVFADGKYGKHAVTHYTVLERFGYVTAVACKLETGRTHQIRAHFKYLGHPLFNDAEYGGDKILKGTHYTKYNQFIQNCFSTCPRHALHAKSLAFTHPKNNERMIFTTELPQDMTQLLERFRSYTVSRYDE